MSRDEERYRRIDHMARRLYYDGERRNAFIAGVEYAYANPMDMWVSVKDTLPPVLNKLDGLSDVVLACSEDGVRMTGIYDYGEKRWMASFDNITTHWVQDNITHWMPLPPLPKREEMYK